MNLIKRYKTALILMKSNISKEWIRFDDDFIMMEKADKIRIYTLYLIKLYCYEYLMSKKIMRMRYLNLLSNIVNPLDNLSSIIMLNSILSKEKIEQGKLSNKIIRQSIKKLWQYANTIDESMANNCYDDDFE